MERLDKVLSSQNIGSRKEIGIMVRQGKVMVNGVVVKKADTKILPDIDNIMVNGDEIEYNRYVYIMMNKPQGVLSATRDPKVKTVLDLLPQDMRRRGLFPAGRLDRDTEGLMILTNDGDYAHRMLAPKSGVTKIYHAKIDSAVTQQDKLCFEQGVVLDDMVCLPAKLQVIEDSCQPLMQVDIQEGKFHQIKRMFQATGHKVLSLKRVRIGALELDETLPLGEARKLSPEEAGLVFV